MEKPLPRIPAVGDWGLSRDTSLGDQLAAYQLGLLHKSEASKEAWRCFSSTPKSTLSVGQEEPASLPEVSQEQHGLPGSGSWSQGHQEMLCTVW